MPTVSIICQKIVHIIFFSSHNSGLTIYNIQINNRYRCLHFLYYTIRFKLRFKLGFKLLLFIIITYNVFVQESYEST
jgi:hypothetical protein